MTPEPGQLRRKTMLGTAALYRVLAVERDLVHVEVIDAPGLLKGQRFRFTRFAVQAMELVDEAAADETPGLEDIVASGAFA